jgi:hypothetical protein
VEHDFVVLFIDLVLIKPQVSVAAQEKWTCIDDVQGLQTLVVQPVRKGG